MEEDFRHQFYAGDAERETTVRIRRIADRENITYLFNFPTEDTFRMKQNSVGQWEFEDRLHAPMIAIDRLSANATSSSRPDDVMMTTALVSCSKPTPGAVVKLDSITLNLVGGGERSSGARCEEPHSNFNERGGHLAEVR